MAKFRTVLISVLMEKNAIITEEIGICSIAAFLESKGHPAEVINSTRTFLDIERIVSMQPDLIGFPVYSTTEQIVVDVANQLKKRLPNAKVCFGGYWPTLNYRYLLSKYTVIDYISIGEGELSFLGLVESLEKGMEPLHVEGVVCRDGQEIVVNSRPKLIQNLDELPYPKRDLLKNSKLKYAYLSTSRGCRGNCSFCWHRSFWDQKSKTAWRGRSPENIIDEIKQIVHEHNINRFWFIDDSFEDCDVSCPRRMWEIVQGIIDSKLNISYETYMRAEIHRKLTEEDYQLLKSSGFVGVIFGIESGNAQDLKLYNKIATVEDNYLAVETFRKHDIAVDIGFINFNPYSSLDRLYQNVCFLKKTGFASVLYYLVERCAVTKLSALYDKVKQDGLLHGEENAFCHPYRYVNEDIGKLSQYLYYKYHENENSAEYFFAKKIGSYIREEIKLLNHVKHQYRHDSKIVDMVTSSEQKAWEILLEANENNSRWFVCLLELVEKRWSDEKAEKISTEFLSLAKVKELSDALEQIRLELYVSLHRHGVSLHQYFNFGNTYDSLLGINIDRG